MNSSESLRSNTFDHTFEKHNFMLLGLDRVVDFATLGEYRVVTDRVVSGHRVREVEDLDIWATDIEWAPADDRRVAPRERVPCSLPRARDRKLARERVRG